MACVTAHIGHAWRLLHRHESDLLSFGIPPIPNESRKLLDSLGHDDLEISGKRLPLVLETVICRTFRQLLLLCVEEATRVTLIKITNDNGMTLTLNFN